MTSAKIPSFLTRKVRVLIFRIEKNHLGKSELGLSLFESRPCRFRFLSDDLTQITNDRNKS